MSHLKALSQAVDP